MFMQVFLFLMCARIILADSVKSLYCVFVATSLPTATPRSPVCMCSYSRQDSENPKTAAEQEDVDTATTSNYTITQA